MHHTQALALLTLLLRTTTAFVPFAHSLHPDINMITVTAPSILSIEPTTLPHSLEPSPASPTLSDPSPTSNEPIKELKVRQAQITAPAAALPVDPDQISPITTYEADSVPPGGGAAVKVPIVYTQTFAKVPDQWELPGVGSIGMGGIQGQIGVVKSKRFVPFVIDQAMTASTFTA